MRDRRYIEHSNDALNELLQYERRDDGSYGAKKGCHDDRLITRAIAMFILDELRGAEVELQKGFMPDYRGNNQQIYNVIGHFYTLETMSRPRILLGAHYDTRPWCDEEEEYSDRFYNVPGANDGASGVGVLLEVARQLGKQLQDSTFRTPVDIIFVSRVV